MYYLLTSLVFSLLTSAADECFAAAVDCCDPLNTCLRVVRRWCWSRGLASHRAFLEPPASHRLSCLRSSDVSC